MAPSNLQSSGRASPACNHRTGPSLVTLSLLFSLLCDSYQTLSLTNKRPHTSLFHRFSFFFCSGHLLSHTHPQPAPIGSIGAGPQQDSPISLCRQPLTARHDRRPPLFHVSIVGACALTAFLPLAVPLWRGDLQKSSRVSWMGESWIFSFLCY